MRHRRVPALVSGLLLALSVAAPARANLDDIPCPVDLGQMALIGQARDERALKQIQEVAKVQFAEILDVLRNNDLAVGHALAHQKVAEILSRNRPNPMKDIEQMQSTVAELGGTTQISGKAAALLQAISVRVKSAAKRGQSGGWLRGARSLVELLPLVGRPLVDATDMGKPIAIVLKEIQADVKNALKANAMANESLQKSLGDMLTAKDRQIRYSQQLKIMAAWLRKASEVNDLAAEEARFLALLSTITLEEARTNLDISTALAEAVHSGEEITIALADSSRTLEREATIGLVRLGTTMVNADAMNRTIQTFEDAAAFRRASAQSEVELGQAMLRAAQLNRDLQKDAYSDKLVAKARGLMEQARAINNQQFEEREYSIQGDIQTLESRLVALENSDTSARARATTLVEPVLDQRPEYLDEGEAEREYPAK